MTQEEMKKLLVGKKLVSIERPTKLNESMEERTRTFIIKDVEVAAVRLITCEDCTWGEYFETCEIVELIEKGEYKERWYHVWKIEEGDNE